MEVGKVVCIGVYNLIFQANNKICFLSGWVRLPTIFEGTAIQAAGLVSIASLKACFQKC